jgi:hypothetical protein
VADNVRGSGDIAADGRLVLEPEACVESVLTIPVFWEDGTDRLHQSMARYQEDAIEDQIGTFESGREAEVVIELGPGFGERLAMSKPRRSLPARARWTAY